MIVIAAIPYIESSYISMAPALLKALIKRHGFDSVAMDLNIEINNRIERSPYRQDLINFFLCQTVVPHIVDDITDCIDYCAKKITCHNPKIIALSLLTYGCEIFSFWLCAKLRQLAPDAEIVLGGPGIQAKLADTNNIFIKSIKAWGLADDVIHGDGELSFVEYVKGNRNFPGINNPNWVGLEDLNDLPIPDYSDFDFSLFKTPWIPIQDSRGCIKSCEFCDIIEMWKKFRFRSADNIFKEMLYQIEKYNYSKFYFRNALINGNLKEFKKLLTMMSDYNQNKPKDKQIHWLSYFIIRDQKSHPPSIWQDIANSNGTIYMGVESVIPSVRLKMGKTYSDADLEYTLYSAKKYSVKIGLLFIVAYPDETLDDYETTKQWFRDHKEYAECIRSLILSIASILPNTALDRKSKERGLAKGKLPGIWINQNLNISPEQRVTYHRELIDVCRENGFVVDHNQEHNLIQTLMNL
jgi:hypothetical protein